MRDALFYVAGTLDQTRGGPDIDCLAAADTAATEHIFPARLRKADEVSGDIRQPRAPTSVIAAVKASCRCRRWRWPTAKLSIDQSRLLAKRLSKQAAIENATPNRAFVQLAFEQILSRDPSDSGTR